MSSEHHSDRQLIGAYQVRRRLGLGGMGEVYLAAAAGPEGVEKPVAIKLIRDLHQQKQQFVELFIEEAKVSFLLTHPNIVQTYEIGQVDGHYFLVMEYVDGTNLEELLAFFSHRLDQPLPAPFALYIGSQIARGLDHAHSLTDQKGRPLEIIHRDVSPSNVLLSRDGLVKVTDFGLAKSVLRRVESQLGQIKGKLAYMAPEQLEGSTLDARADIYSLGVVLYETLSGQHPFGSLDEISLASRLRGREVTPLASRAPHLEPQVVALVERCMFQNPDQRFESSRELGQQIDRTMRELGLGVSDYELADFISRARSEAEAKPQAPHPFDQALGMELRKVGGQDAGASTFIRVPTDERGTSDETAPARRPSTTLPPLSRRRWPLLLAVLALVAGAGVVALIQSRGGGSSPAAAIAPDLGGTPAVTAGVHRPDAAEARPGSRADSAAVLKGTLHVKPLPPGGKVYVAGLPRGTAPLSLSGLAPGRPLEVRIEHAGRRTYQQRVTLQPGQELTLRPRLLPAGRLPGAKQTKRYGTISVNSDPWSHIFIDGVRIRSTPLVGHRLVVGKHLVRLVNPVRKLEAKRAVVIREGKETRLSVELSSK